VALIVLILQELNARRIYLATFSKERVVRIGLCPIGILTLGVGSFNVFRCHFDGITILSTESPASLREMLRLESETLAGMAVLLLFMTSPSSK
jgi:hypothetical protein